MKQTKEGGWLFRSEDFTSEAEFVKYRWGKGRLGETLLGREFFRPRPPRRVIDGHDPIKLSAVYPRNFPDDAHHLDAVLYDGRSRRVEGVLEVKTTTTASERFELRGACGHFMRLAEEKRIPIWFGIVRLRSDFPKEIVEMAPETFVKEHDLSPFVLEGIVYQRATFEFTENDVWLHPGAVPEFRWTPGGRSWAVRE